MSEEVTIRKGYRVNLETDKKIKELIKYYNVKSENELFSAIINEIYDIKKNKAIVPFKTYEQEKIKLEKAIFEIGRLKGALEEKEKQLEELKQKRKGFWAKLFGR